jgi:hypothetical protein
VSLTCIIIGSPIHDSAETSRSDFDLEISIVTKFPIDMANKCLHYIEVIKRKAGFNFILK